MTRFRVEDGVTIQLTAQEEIDRDAEEADWLKKNPPRTEKSHEAEVQINKLESQETPRRLAESVLSDEGKAWLTSNRQKIAIERAKL